jgi:hypothetical protein
MTDAEKKFFKFPDTPSFLGGLCGGVGSTAFVAGQEDWWVWLLAGFSAALYASWKMASYRLKEKAKEKRP